MDAFRWTRRYSPRTCRDCQAAYKRAYSRAHPDQYRKAWKAKNVRRSTDPALREKHADEERSRYYRFRKRILAGRRLRHAANRDAYRQKWRDYYWRNRDRICARRRKRAAAGKTSEAQSRGAA